MNKNLLEKIELIKKIDTDDSKFILNVYNSFQKKEEELEKKKQSSSIILNQELIESKKNIINLDNLWAKPYFYTKMRMRLEGIIKGISNIDTYEILKKPSKFCNNVIFNNNCYFFEKTEKDIDIVEFIQLLNEKKKNNPEESLDYVFTAKQIDEETLFKEEQLKIAIKIINVDNLYDRNEMIYDEVYNYLTKDFIANNYCDFCNNKCVAQRKHQTYPINRKDGCCFTRIRKCPHLKNGNCTVECLACRLFSCPYLSKRGIGYWASDFILLKAFFTKKQRKHLVFDFYQPKQKILKKIYDIT